MELVITVLPVVTKDLPISLQFTPYEFSPRCKFSTLDWLIDWLIDWMIPHISWCQKSSPWSQGRKIPSGREKRTISVLIRRENGNDGTRVLEKSDVSKETRKKATSPKGPAVCVRCVWGVCVVLFGRFPRELFSPECFFFLKISPLTLSYPRGNRFPKKIYILPRGVLRGYYGTYDITLGFSPTILLKTAGQIYPPLKSWT